MPLFSLPPPYNQPLVSSELREIVDGLTALRQMAKQEQVELMKQLQVLESRLTGLKFKPEGNATPKVLAFPLSLRSGARVPRDSSPPPREQSPPRSIEEKSEGGIKDEIQSEGHESDTHQDIETGDQRPRVPMHGHLPRSPYIYQPLDAKILERLKAAVTTYGPVAPFTLALLESYTEGWLTPREFTHLAKASLSGGDFVLWKSKAADAAQEIEAKNRQRPESRDWTARRILGKEPFNTLEAQMQYPTGLLSQVRQVCLTAWKRLPDKVGSSSKLTIIIQDPEEPYSSFINRLTEAAEHLFGPQELAHFLNNLLLKMLMSLAKIY